MSRPPITTIDELTLNKFRVEMLSPDRLLELVRSERYTLATIPVGGGKSFAADRLLSFRQLYERFDLVVYAAPAWNIIEERAILRGTVPSPVEFAVLEARPHEMCGRLDAQWRDFERRGCSALAKETLCSKCSHRDKCPFPNRFSDIKGIRLVFATEQQLSLHRNLIQFLMMITKATNVLVVLDEAKLIDVDFEIQITVEDIERFVDALARSEGPSRSLKAAWRVAMQRLAAGREPLDAMKIELPDSINKHAAEIQQIGMSRYGNRFRYRT